MVAQLSTSIEEMDAVSLNYWLGKSWLKYKKEEKEAITKEEELFWAGLF